jgi:hypothetical protein
VQRHATKSYAAYTEIRSVYRYLFHITEIDVTLSFNLTGSDTGAHPSPGTRCYAGQAHHQYIVSRVAAQPGKQKTECHQ